MPPSGEHSVGYMVSLCMLNIYVIYTVRECGLNVTSQLTYGL
jgi:hypothetical protein